MKNSNIELEYEIMPSPSVVRVRKGDKNIIYKTCIGNEVVLYMHILKVGLPRPNHQYEGGDLLQLDDLLSYGFHELNEGDDVTEVIDNLAKFHYYYLSSQNVNLLPHGLWRIFDMKSPPKDLEEKKSCLKWLSSFPFVKELDGLEELNYTEQLKYLCSLPRTIVHNNLRCHHILQADRDMANSNSLMTNVVFVDWSRSCSGPAIVDIVMLIIVTRNEENITKDEVIKYLAEYSEASTLRGRSYPAEDLLNHLSVYSMWLLFEMSIVLYDLWKGCCLGAQVEQSTFTEVLALAIRLVKVIKEMDVLDKVKSFEKTSFPNVDKLQKISCNLDQIVDLQMNPDRGFYVTLNDSGEYHSHRHCPLLRDVDEIIKFSRDKLSKSIPCSICKPKIKNNSKYRPDPESPQPWVLPQY